MKTKVKLVAITQPLLHLNDDENERLLTADEFIAYCARVSNPSNQMNTETAPKLLQYCIKHKHWSVFEQVVLNFELNTTREIARQILRHKFNPQEFSQRYANPLVDLEWDLKEARLQDKKNRQNSVEVDDEELAIAWHDVQEHVINTATIAYEFAIEHGIAKEIARAVLPEGLIMTRMYISGTLRNFLHYCAVRTSVETQKEHRIVAQMIWDIIMKQFPSLGSEEDMVKQHLGMKTQ